MSSAFDRDEIVLDEGRQWELVSSHREEVRSDPEGRRSWMGRGARLFGEDDFCIMQQFAELIVRE